MSQHFTKEWIRIRCTAEDDGDCMLWDMGTNPAGAPIATKLLPTGKKPTFQIRRVTWELKNGPIPQGMVVGVTCGNARCLRHLALFTKAEILSRQWATTNIRAKRTAASTKASRKRAKLDMETARSIRQSNDTLETVAAEHGISMTLASLIRRGERWKEAGNPFAGLGA